jgi:hypothetical protein
MPETHASQAHAFAESLKVPNAKKAPVVSKHRIRKALMDVLAMGTEATLRPYVVEGTAIVGNDTGMWVYWGIMAALIARTAWNIRKNAAENHYAL